MDPTHGAVSGANIKPGSNQHLNIAKTYLHLGQRYVYNMLKMWKQRSTECWLNSWRHSVTDWKRDVTSLLPFFHTHVYGSWLYLILVYRRWRSTFYILFKLCWTNTYSRNHGSVPKRSPRLDGSSTHCCVHLFQHQSMSLTHRHTHTMKTIKPCLQSSKKWG